MRRPAEALAVLLCIATVSGILCLVANFPLNPDVGWFLTMTRRLLAGDVLYREVLDVNPPLIIYLLVPVVVVSEATALTDSASLVVWVVLLAVSGIGWFIRLTGVMSGWVRVSWWVTLLGLALLLVPGPDFGQREHFMILLTLPYLGVTYRRLGRVDIGTLEATLAGVVAGLGFAIKPYFVLIWLALEILIWTRRKQRTPHFHAESIAVLVMLFAYALFILSVHLDYLRMMRWIGPLYSDFSSEPFRFLFIAYFSLPMLVVAGAFAATGMTGRQREVTTAFLVFGAAGFVGALIQGKGWRYHSLPLIVSTVLCCGAMFEHSIVKVFRRSNDAARLREWFVLGILLIALFPLSDGITHALSLAKAQRTESMRRASAVAEFRPTSILILGDVVDDAFPLVNLAEAISASPFPSMWWLRVRYGTGREVTTGFNQSQRTPVERRLAAMLVDDFLATAPELVLVDTVQHRRFGEQAFPYIQYFSRDSAFAAAWLEYERVSEVDGFAVWQATGSASHRPVCPNGHLSC